MADEIDPIAADIAREQRAQDAVQTPPAQLSALPSLKLVQAPRPEAAPAAPDVDPIALQIKQEQDRQNAQQAGLLDWRARNDKVDAATRADVLRYAAASELPPNYVEKNLDAVRRKVDADKVDWNQVAYRQPALVQFLLEQPQAMPLVKDDVAQLKGLEWAIKAPYHALGDAIGEQVTIGRQFAEAFGVGSEENRARIAELEQQYSDKDYGADTFVQKGVVGLFKVGPYLLGDILARGAGGGIGAMLLGGEGAGAGAAAGTPAAGVGAAPGAVGGAVVGGVAGATGGQFVGSALFNYYEALGPLHHRLSQLRDSNGEPLNPDVVDAFAQAGAGLQGILMAGFVGKIGSKLPGAKTLLGKLAAGPVEKALTETTLSQALAKNAVGFGKHWLTGATMMGVQSAMNAATLEGAKEASGQPIEAQWSNVSESAKNGFIAGLEDMWLLSAIGPGRELVSDIGRLRASEVSRQKLEAMVGAAAESKLLERSPEAFASALKKMVAQPGAEKTVLIPEPEWTSYWQSKKEDPAEVAANVAGDGGKGYADAVRTKGDVAIPVEAYVTKLAQTEHAAALNEVARLRADELSPKQAKEEVKRQQQKLEREAKVRGAELQTGKKEVHDFIRDQAVAAGIEKGQAAAVAKLLSENAGTMALRLGVSVNEAAALGGYGNLRILGPKGEAVAQSARERFRQFLRPEASAELERRLESLTPEQRANEYYLDEHVSGLRNRRVFDAVPVPEGQQVAAISTPHAKDVNDNFQHGGHDVGNELFRAMGKVIGESHPDAAREGTTFFLHVKDQAELDQVLAKLHQQLGNNLRFTGGLGPDSKLASKAEGSNSDRLRTPETPETERLPPRGTPDARVDLSKLKLPEGKHAGATVPDHLREQIAALPAREYAQKAYLDRVRVGGKEVETGLLSAEGWRGIPRKLHTVAFDLRNLKMANLAGGEGSKEGGNALLFHFADIASQLGGSSFDLAHLSGDEYAAQSNDPAQLRQFVDRLEARFKDVKLRVTDPTTGKVERVPVAFRHGEGPDYGKADRDLNRRKSAEGQPGGDRVPGPADLGAGNADRAVPGPAEAGTEQAGVPGGGGGRPEEPGRPPPDVRGARPQGFEEVATYFDGKPVTVGPSDNRGHIVLRFDPSGSGKPVSFDVQVFKGDRSTLVHELGHFLGWSFHDLATSQLATPEVRADYEGLLKFAGYGSAAERQAETLEHTALSKKADRTEAENARLKRLTAKEERISHAWEQYLLEGKSPSEGLAKVFSRFKGWMIQLYKGIEGIRAQFRRTQGEELVLTDDVRRIFDRLLAEDEAISQARNETGNLGADPEAVKGMSPAEAKAYREAMSGAQLAAEKRVAAERAGATGPKLDEARAKIQGEVEAELDQQPLYRAQRYLQRGELVDESGRLDASKPIPEILLDKEGQPLKINRKAFVETFGAELAKKMPGKVFGRTKNAGVEVEQLAPLLGFEDARALVDAFTSNPPRDEAIADKVKSRVDAELGPQLKQLADAALAGVHSPDAFKATVMEIRALAKQLDPAAAARARSIDLEVLKEHVARLVADMPVGELDPIRFARAERSTALKARELWGAGKKEESLDHSEARLLNQLLFAEARDAKEELGRAEKRLEKTSEDVRAKLGLAHPAFRDVHDKLLGVVGLSDAPGPELGLTGLLQQLQQVVGDNAQQLDFDGEALKQLETRPREWGELTVDQARNVVDAVTNIRHLAAQTLELKLAGKKQSKAQWFEEFQRKLATRKPLPPEPFDNAAKGLGSKLRHLGRGADAMLTDTESYAHDLDVGDRGGPVHRLLVDARLEARETATKLSSEVLKKIVEKWDEVPKQVRALIDREVQVDLPVPPGTEGRLKPVYTRSSLYMLFLNWGNEGNKQRIRDGNGWGDDKVQKALEQLQPVELKFLQGVLDTINSLHPELARVHEERTGLKLGKVEATPITINGETYGGGYFPLRYRPDISRPGEFQEGEAIRNLFAPNYVRPSTASSARKARAEKVKAPVDLNWGVVPAHLSQVIHDISYGDWVRQAGSILLDPQFKALTAQHLGPERAQEFVPWLRDVANARADSASAAHSNFIDKLGGFARNRAAIAVMGLNLPAILPQVLDPWNAPLEGVGPHHVVSAYAQVVTSLAGLKEIPELQLSKELQYREAQLKDNLRSELAAIGPTGKRVGRKVSEVAFALYELSDRFTTRVAWKAAFDSAQTDGLPREEAAARADDVVRRTYASHDVAEKPPLLRSKKGIAAAVMFYSFANRLYNSLRRSVADIGIAAAQGEGRSAAVGRLAGKLMMMGLTGAAVAYVGGRGPKKDEDIQSWLAWRVALEPFNTVPFIGPMVEVLHKGGKVNVRTSPELALLQDTIQRIADLGNEDKMLEAAGSLVGLGLGVPAWLQRAAVSSGKLATGAERARNPIDAADQVFYGKKKNPVHTPLSDIADRIR